MEKFSYNYPDSTDSSPRSREIDFDNTPPWDDHNNNNNNHQQPYKVKFMCSYGGKILPRQHDNQLTYINGETKILSVDRTIRFPVLSSKLTAIVNGGDNGVDVSFKYQLPGEDLDALISVTNDDDLENMMHEYDRLLRLSSKPARMRLFLFPASVGFGSQGSTQSDRDRFVDAINNTVPRLSESETSVITACPNNINNADFLFGSEKITAQPIEVKLPVQPVIKPDLNVNPVEFQKQIRDQEIQQEACYRRKHSEDGLIETGGYFSPPYAQNPIPQPQMQTQPQPTIPQINQQTPLMNYWQGNQNPVGVFATKTAPEKQQPVYMIPSLHNLASAYHAPQQSVMRPQVNQTGFYPPVQQQQPPYIMAQPPQLPIGTRPQQQQPPPQTFTTGPPPPQYSAVPAYTQVAYAGGPGKQVYYTEAPPPPLQYHGIGLPVTSGMNELRPGPDGKLVAVTVNMATKVSSQGSDSAI